jgi:hypothetical protein
LLRFLFFLALGGFFYGLRFGAPSRRGVTFFSGKKESHQRKLTVMRGRAERSDGPLLRWALGSLIGGLVTMPVAGWFYRSFANSFTLCLNVSFVLQTLLAASCLFFNRSRQAERGHQ